MAVFKQILFSICLSATVLAQKESLIIGPGDELTVQVFDTPDLSESARVSDAGEFPLVLGGKVKLASLTPIEAAQMIETTLIQAHIMNYPRVMVSVAHYATQNVTIFGQVVKPGTYPLETPRSLVDVLTLAGGLTDLADRQVTIERHISHRQITYDVSNRTSDLLEHNVMVNPGDRVVVAKAGIVYVLGDVGRPGGYPMTNNDGTLTVLQAVANAGGTINSAAPNSSRLIRRTADGSYQSNALPFSSMQKGKKPDVPLQAGDIVYVPFSYMRNAALGITGVFAAASSAAIYVK